MAIVTCKSCGRWLYRPDEMSGTAWQCIVCGPTEIGDTTEDVPERLAQLIEEEYKRVVWGTIYPRSADLTASPNFNLERSPIPMELPPNLRALSHRQLADKGWLY